MCPVIRNVRARFNMETVGSQSQVSVRERTVRIKYNQPSLFRLFCIFGDDASLFLFILIFKI